MRTPTTIRKTVSAVDIHSVLMTRSQSNSRAGLLDVEGAGFPNNRELTPWFLRRRRPAGASTTVAFSADF